MCALVCSESSFSCAAGAVPARNSQMTTNQRWTARESADENDNFIALGQSILNSTGRGHPVKPRKLPPGIPRERGRMQTDATESARCDYVNGGKGAEGRVSGDPPR